MIKNPREESFVIKSLCDESSSKQIVLLKHVVSK